jgi:hypothetical protein
MKTPGTTPLFCECKDTLQFNYSNQKGYFNTLFSKNDLQERFRL